MIEHIPTLMVAGMVIGAVLFVVGVVWGMWK